MFFVLRDHQIVGEHLARVDAEAQYRALRAHGWPITRSAAVYEADGRQQMQDHLDKRVRLVCAGVGDGYWDSPEGRAQQEAAKAEDAAA